MLRSRANASSKEESDASRNHSPAMKRTGKRRKRPRQNNAASTPNIFAMLLFVLTIIGSVCYYLVHKHKTSNHIVKTMHLRKSALKGGIESPQEDDLVPEDSIYNLMYPSMKHNGELVPLANFAGRVAIVINVACE